MKKRGAPLKVPATPEAAALQARRQAAKRMHDKARLEELRRLKALDRLQIARHTPESATARTLKDLFGGMTRERAVKVVMTIMTKSKDDELRFAAAKYVLDRTDGPVQRSVEIGGRDGGPIHVSDERPSLAQLLGTAGQAAIGHVPTINGEASEPADDL